MFENQSIYDEKYRQAIRNDQECWGGNERYTCRLKQIQDILKSGIIPAQGKVLEAGCGEGHLCQEFHKKGYDVTGIDFSKAAIDWAKNKNLIHKPDINYIHEDLSKPDLNLNDIFDLIIDGNCLHCIIGTRRQYFLENLYHHLSQSGVLYISSLISNDHDNHTTEIEGIPYRFIPHPDYLKAELENSGFILIKQVLHERDEYNHINMYLHKI
ncbi:MAG: class I SAM-dependent methyltransferase [Spirochaetes bacterium]|nr:class I SAM-dependent methyltransferase [Spirochaetota bacterium]